MAVIFNHMCAVALWCMCRLMSPSVLRALTKRERKCGGPRGEHARVSTLGDTGRTCEGIYPIGDTGRTCEGIYPRGHRENM